MARYIELTPRDLKIDFEFLPNFESTVEILPFENIIGQERATEAIDLGLGINKSGYNIFVCGNSGTGKRSYVLKRLREFTKSSQTPMDWCYVYNFTDNQRPLAISLNPGSAERFKEDIEKFINQLFEEVPKYFSEEGYEKERNSTIDLYQKEILKLADRLYDESKDKDFNVKNTGEGFAFIPLKEGEEMTEKQYSEISEEEKEEINNRVAYLKMVAIEIVRKTKILKKEMAEKLKELDDKLALSIIKEELTEFREKYGYNSKVLDYLNNLEKDIIDNIEAFMDLEDQEDKFDENFFKRYLVNVMVSNKEDGGMPIVYEETPEYHDLLGIIEYENKLGTMVTDFTMIKPGSLHRANGGYIVIEALQLLTSYQGWSALKKAIKCGKINIENLKNQFDIIPLVTLKPEEIPLNIKVILLGNPYIYYLLYNYDDDFKELFKIKAEFENEIKNSNGTIMKLLGFISSYCSDEDILPLSREGVIELLKYSLRTAESKKYFTASMDRLVDVIEQSQSIALSENGIRVEKEHVVKAVDAFDRRHGNYRDKILDMYRDGKYLVKLEGYETGQINALSVIDFGDYSFGRQNRVTVTTHVGTEGIINIEREANMSGNIHSKGVMILSGFIGETFGQNIHLSFNARICFEQLYGGIEGDSASAAELICLMSSLASIPIKQSIAVTGSVNQKGEIQPVGGINDKIEGYFSICKALGQTGEQGVIIPFSNLDELVLSDEIIEAVEKNKFHIYAVKEIEDCLEILCDMSSLGISGKKGIMDVMSENIALKLSKYKNVYNDKGKK